MLHVLMNTCRKMLELLVQEVNTKERKSELERLTCIELKTKLAERKLKQTGKKKELIDSLQIALNIENKDPKFNESEEQNQGNTN